MSKVLFITNIERRYLLMLKAQSMLQAEGTLSTACRSIQITEATPWGAEWQKTLAQADVVILKWMGSGLDTPFLKKVAEFLKKTEIKHFMMLADTEKIHQQYGFTEAATTRLQAYLLYGGMKNFCNVWLWLDSYFGELHKEVEAPEPLPWAGIYHPRATKFYDNISKYRKDYCQDGKPTVGILFYRDEWVWGDLTYQRALINEAEAQGLNVICVFSNGMPSKELGMPSLVEVFTAFFCEKMVPCIDVFINTTKFSLTVSRSLTLAYLKQWKLPFLQAYTILAAYQEWERNLEGMNAMEISISVTLPEFDGAIHSVPIAAKERNEVGELSYRPIKERIIRLCNKAKKWANLRRKANAEKKVAIIFHNYPAKNSNLGSAVGLDSVASIRLVLAELQKHGYTVENIPADGQAFIEELTSNATNDRNYLSAKQLERAQKLTCAEYQNFFYHMPLDNQQQLIKDWGDAPGEVFNYSQELIIPGTLKGNIFVTVQPPRGFGEDPGKILHSPFCAPTHHYLGYYHWLRDIWCADAVIHVGTHGSLEWLPGKNAGLAVTCYPDLALGDLPNIYPYLITIVGEGLQAKRRGAACLIGHLTPPMTHSGMYDELAELEQLLEEYSHFKSTQPENLDKLVGLVRIKATAANLEKEISEQNFRNFEDYVQALHGYLTDIKNMQIRSGLHIMGQAPTGEMLLEYLVALVRMDNGKIPSLSQTLASCHGFDYYELVEHSSTLLADGSKTYGALVDQIWEECKEIICLLQKQNFNGKDFSSITTLNYVTGCTTEVQNKLLSICTYICQNLVPNLAKTVEEMTNMLSALDGEYVEPGPSGAPTSGGADILPTGRNFYGVDSRNLPTPAAWELGKALAEQVIERFIAEEGHYPESVGIVLWSGSNMRSHGQCLAEFMYLLGVRPVWQKSSKRVVAIEVIPLAELRRPRIDVTARISGLFRDSMPVAITWLDQAVQLVAKQEENPEQNFVRKHFLTDTKELLQEGRTVQEAWQEAGFRIFGDELGVYGAGVAALLEAKNWESIDDIADVYVRWGAHAYGGKTRGKFLPERFRKRMGSLDITVKNEDNVETNMLSSDDYNAYHGGMIAAVRSIKGSAPKSYCGDTTDRSKVILRSVQEETKRIFRGEATNPKFIAGMMQHGYKGASDLANYVAHSYQWDATSEVMEDWMYEKFAEKYAFAPQVQEWMQKVNPWALQRIAEVLLEAEQRGLWQAQPETKKALQKLYLSIEGELEERSDD
ncbi:MAG: cobaltochelatase subunit CobN [Acidaminococcaceae bacterium]